MGQIALLLSINTIRYCPLFVTCDLVLSKSRL